MSNRKSGDDFEVECASALAANGFWVHRLKQNSAGQPFDIIAVKDGYATAIDCKVCEKDVFDLSRIEENQLNAMELWESCGNGNGWFALKLSDGRIKMISFSQMDCFGRLFGKRMSREAIMINGTDLPFWIRCEYG